MKDFVEAALQHARLSGAELGRRMTEKLGRSIDRAAVSKMRSGLRDVAADEMLAIAEITGYSEVDLGRPASAPEAPLPTSKYAPRVPVFAAVEGGGDGELLLNKDPIEWEPRPEPLAHISSGYLVHISGSSMWPEFKPGERAIVNDRLPPQPDEVHIFYTDDAQDDRAMIKLLVRETRQEWIVAQYNPAKEFELLRVDWPRCHRVVGKFSRR
jgi:phage repressor protein C with HTH and peptisase S24 domain